MLVALPSVRRATAGGGRWQASAAWCGVVSDSHPTRRLSKRAPPQGAVYGRRVDAFIASTRPGSRPASHFDRTGRVPRAALHPGSSASGVEAASHRTRPPMFIRSLILATVLRTFFDTSRPLTADLTSSGPTAKHRVALSTPSPARHLSATPHMDADTPRTLSSIRSGVRASASPLSATCAEDEAQVRWRDKG